MTAIEITNTRDRAQRIAGLWARMPDWTEQQVCDQVDNDLRFEAAEQAERDAKTRALTDSYAQMVACPVCGANALGNKGGLCDPCGQTAAILQAEQAAAQKVNGRTRKALVGQYLASRGG